MYRLIFRLVAFETILFNDVLGHGRMIDPPSRASMWRYGFKTPANYDDHQMYCGGFGRQQQNNGKCGVCGDPWDVTTPRPHEAGGKYANGIIVRSYRMGSLIPVKIELTSNHQGYFEFRICPVTRPGVEVTDECLDKHVLVGDNGTARYYPGPGNKVFEMKYKLPNGLNCDQCVLQWRYLAGNNWGKCADGTERIGCGPHEQYRACADISISSDNEVRSTPSTSSIPDKSDAEFRDSNSIEGHEQDEFNTDLEDLNLIDGREEDEYKTEFEDVNQIRENEDEEDDEEEYKSELEDVNLTGAEEEDEDEFDTRFTDLNTIRGRDGDYKMKWFFDDDTR